MKKIISTTAVLLALAAPAFAASAKDDSAFGQGQPQAKMYRIGMVATIPLSAWRQLPTSQALLSGLHDLGYDEGRNFAFEYRWIDRNWERLPEVAKEVVAQKVDVIVQNVCGAALNAARQATKTIPIVVAACNDDMIETGIIASRAHPGGNVTGLNKMTPELTAKRLDLLKEIVPKATNVTVLWDPGYSAYVADWRELRARAEVDGVKLRPIEVRTASDLEQTFGRLAQEQPDAILTLSDVLTYVFAKRVAALATDSKLPIVTPFKEITAAGGLMSYGPSVPNLFRQAAGYVDAILKGASAAELPVEQPTNFELVINTKTAKALELDVSPTFLARADEVIE
jgi:putative ABC transport system substrate-binding protein